MDILGPIQSQLLNLMGQFLQFEARILDALNKLQQTVTVAASKNNASLVTRAQSEIQYGTGLRNEYILTRDKATALLNDISVIKNDYEAGRISIFKVMGESARISFTSWPVINKIQSLFSTVPTLEGTANGLLMQADTGQVFTSPFSLMDKILPIAIGGIGAYIFLKIMDKK